MKNIAKALLSVQQNLDPVHKGRQGYGYKYADLPAVMEACLEGLNKAGVLVVQSPDKTDKAAACVVTRLIHAESGEEICGTIEVPHGEIAKMSIAQAYGSAMTYARRYALVSMLGIVTEDDDGAGAGKRVACETKVETKPEPKPEVSLAEKTKNATEFAKKLVDLFAMFKGGDAKAFVMENQKMYDACLKYPEAQAILEEGGLA